MGVSQHRGGPEDAWFLLASLKAKKKDSPQPPNKKEGHTHMRFHMLVSA